MKLPLAVAGLCFGIVLHAQTPLRLSGSTTVKGALEPQRAALETAVGRRIDLAGTGTNAGLVSLLVGDADVAMLSTPLEEVAQAINATKTSRVDPAAFHAEHIGDARIVFIVNPHNRVRSLSTEQVKGVLTGNISNWKELGGPDAAIVVVSLAHGGPLLRERLLDGQPITAKAHGVPNATQIPIVVAQDPNAIGIISTAHSRGQTSVLQTDATVIEPLFLVTKGPPSPEVQRLVATAKKLLGGA